MIFRLEGLQSCVQFDIFEAGDHTDVPDPIWDARVAGPAVEDHLSACVEILDYEERSPVDLGRVRAKLSLCRGQVTRPEWNYRHCIGARHVRLCVLRELQ